jgi:hypothetical protein
MLIRYLLVGSFIIGILYQHVFFSAGATVLNLDRSAYTPFDKITITLTDSSLNKNSEKVESAQVSISGATRSERIVLRETSASSGMFQSEVRLSPDLAKFPGDLQVRRDDGITVSYRIDPENILSETVLIEFHEASGDFDKASYQINDVAKVRLIDRDAGRNPDAPDIVNVKIWSETDTTGLALSLRETEKNNGIFEESLLFTLTDISSGNRLRVSDSDTINMSYVDNTLPAPAQLSSDGLSTLQTKNLYVTATFGRYLPSAERAPATEPELVDSSGKTLSEISVGDQVLIQSEVSNVQTKKQPFAYIVQVKDSQGVTVSLSWVTSVLPANESLKVARSWLPSQPGNYTIEVFVWEALTDPAPLSPIRTKDIRVLG